MYFEVSFTPKAEQDFEVILNYIDRDFGDRATINFRKLLLDIISLLEQFHEIGSIEVNHKNIRGFVIHRRLKVFYRIKNNKVIVLRLFDTRQHPNKKNQ